MDTRRGVVEPITGSRAAFCLWAALGAVGAFALIIFPLVAVLPVLFGAWLARSHPALGRAWFGALTGAGVMPLTVAFLQRRGPGTVCWHTAMASGCDQYLNPWPWLVVGVLLVVAGLIVRARRTRAPAPPAP